MLIQISCCFFGWEFHDPMVAKIVFQGTVNGLMTGLGGVICRYISE